MSARIQRYAARLAVALAFAVVAPSVSVAGPEVRGFRFTDITPRSFRVVWLADQEATATVRLFQAPACTNEIFTATITPHPTLGGDPALVSAAQAKGIMVVEVAGLAPDTEYCVSTVTVASLTSLSAAAPALPLRVTTEKLTTRGRASGPSVLAFTNDLVKLSITSTAPTAPTRGALVLLRASGASSSLAAWVGDSIDDDNDATSPTTFVYFDLNNLYDATTRESLDLLGDGSEDLSAIVLGSPEGYVEAIGHLLPADAGLAELLSPGTCRNTPLTVCRGRLGDSDNDGMVTLGDADAVQDHVVDLIPVLSCMVCADATADLATDMKDALAIGQTAVGLRILP